MTSAAQQAVVLGEALDRTGVVDRRFARRYFKAAGRIVKVPWSIAIGGDFAYPGTTGKKPPFTDLLNRYKYLHLIAVHDHLLVEEIGALERELAAQDRELQRNLAQLERVRSEQLSEFAQLQNLIDLAVLGALLRKEQLPEKAGWTISRFLDPEWGNLDPGPAPRQHLEARRGRRRLPA
jgi:hypothetical protein